jgi:single-strand DNA-binding protein
MANLNKVMLIGRLTRDPEVRTFSTGGKVAKIGFAVNNRKKNQQTGQWEDVPVFIDVDAFNWERRKLADLVEQYLRKGHQVYIEGSLVLDQWTSQDGQKRSKLKVVVNDLQFLEPRKDGGTGEPTPPSSRKPASYPAAAGFDEPEGDGGGAPEPPEGDIPF